MQTIVIERLPDRAEFPPGPWDGEPDKKQWLDEETGLPCLIVRGPMGAWCGYVGVSQGHPLFEKSYWEGQELEVHGRLTYSDHCDGIVCHVVEEGEDDNVWWLGFDCSHAGDLAPSTEPMFAALTSLTDCLSGIYSRGGCAYRDINYVTNECRSLASQLAAIPAD